MYRSLTGTFSSPITLAAILLCSMMSGLFRESNSIGFSFREIGVVLAQMILALGFSFLITSTNALVSGSNWPSGIRGNFSVDPFTVRSF